MRADGTDVRQVTDNQWEQGAIGWASQPPNGRYLGAQESLPTVGSWPG